MTVPEILFPSYNRCEAFIKRLIGLLEETVAATGGQVLVDGVLLQENHLLEPLNYE